ncbi:fumarate hydratase [Desulfothermus sp.]
MRVINSDDIYSKMKQVILEAGCNLPKDVEEAIEKAYKNETLDSAKEVLSQLLENSKLARESKLPLCQDTGVGIFFVEIGDEVKIQGEHISDVLTRAMVDAYREGYFRKSLCNPFSRKNTGDNTPAMIHYDLVKGDSLKVLFMAKGGGSENMSRCTMLAPAAGWEGIKEFVVKRVAESGPNPCPPIIVGVGIGGTFDYAPILAKKALFRPLKDRHPDEDIAKKEEELLDAINHLGIGPMGLGGKTTALGVKINVKECHIASLPVAVNIQCHSARYKEVIF